MSLTPEEVDHHRRHILLKEIGGPGVQKLRAVSISLIGAGALGGPCALYLAAAGVGQLEIWDDDLVERSNLQRQIQFGERDIGQPKAEVLAALVSANHPGTRVTVQRRKWAAGTPLSGRVLIDACDNFATRYALNEAAHLSRRPMVHAAAAGWTAQVSIFASGLKEGAPCYRCWVPETPPAAEACDEVGVVGAVTGLAGTAMALEAIKLVTGAGTPLIGRLLLISGLDGTQRIVNLPADPACPVCHAS